MLFLTVAVSVSHAMHATAVNSPAYICAFLMFFFKGNLIHDMK